MQYFLYDDLTTYPSTHPLTSFRPSDPPLVLLLLCAGAEESWLANISTTMKTKMPASTHSPTWVKASWVPAPPEEGRHTGTCQGEVGEGGTLLCGCILLPFMYYFYSSVSVQCDLQFQLTNVHSVAWMWLRIGNEEKHTHTHTHLPGPCSRLPAAGVGTHPPADHRLQSWAAEAAHSTHLYKEGCGNCTECYINGGKSTGQLEHFHFFSFTLSLSKQ